MKSCVLIVLVLLFLASSTVTGEPVAEVIEVVGDTPYYLESYTVSLLKSNNIQTVSIPSVDGEDYWYIIHSGPYRKKLTVGMKLDYRDVVGVGPTQTDYVVVKSLIDGSTFKVNYNGFKAILWRPTTTTTISGKDCSYTGSWNSDWGEMVLVQSGNSLYGDYDWDEGIITGTVNNGILRGTWSEYPSYSPNSDAGDIEFFFADDCNSFTGSWSYGSSSGGWDGTWWGVKMEPTRTTRPNPNTCTTLEVTTTKVTTTTTTTVPGVLKGTITDGHGNIMPYLDVEVKVDGKGYDGVTDKTGNYRIEIPDFAPSTKKPKEVTIKTTFNYKRDGKNYFSIFDNLVSGDLLYFEKKFKLKTEADKTQNIDFMIAAPAKTTTHGDLKSNTYLTNLEHLAPIYFHTHEAVEFALKKLKVTLDYKLPVEVYVGKKKGTYYSPTNSIIVIDIRDAHYGSSNRPDNREYHEFAHHIMYDVYGSWPSSGGTSVNHGGFLNDGTSDSYLEGFAEFMAMAMSEYHGDAKPEIYAGFGSFESNYNPWDWKGKTEEIAVAGILWDLYDGNKDHGDDVDLTLDEMWAVLKVKRRDFNEYYKSFKAVYPTKSSEIDKVFIYHGFFEDKTVGNKKRDSFEPYRDANKNKKYDAGEYFIDYGQPPAGILRQVLDYWMTYDTGEVIGRASNYARNRSMAVTVDNAFIKVSDTEIRNYRVYVHFNNQMEGADYDYRVDVRSGLIYLMPLPSDLNVTITVKPDSQDYVASDVYVISNAEYARKYYETSEDQGYFDEHTFDLQPTGSNVDELYVTIDGEEPIHDLDEGPDEPFITTTTLPNISDDLDGFCCIGLILPLLASLAGVLVKIL